MHRKIDDFLLAVVAWLVIIAFVSLFGSLTAALMGIASLSDLAMGLAQGCGIIGFFCFVVLALFNFIDEDDE